MVNDDISKYKNTTIQLLINDEDILTLIDEPAIITQDPSELMYQNIYPYTRIPKEQPQEEVKAFILLSVSVPNVSTANYFFKDMMVTLTVLCHSAKMRTSYGGTRVDLLTAAIRNVLNGNKEFSGRRLEYVSDIEGFLQGGTYFYREIRFITTDINKSGNC